MRREKEKTGGPSWSLGPLQMQPRLYHAMPSCLPTANGSFLGGHPVARLGSLPATGWSRAHPKPIGPLPPRSHVGSHRPAITHNRMPPQLFVPPPPAVPCLWVAVWEGGDQRVVTVLTARQRLEGGGRGGVA